MDRKVAEIAGHLYLEALGPPRWRRSVMAQSAHLKLGVSSRNEAAGRTHELGLDAENSDFMPAG